MRPDGGGGTPDFVLDVDPTGVDAAAGVLDGAHGTLQTALTALQKIPGDLPDVATGAFANSFTYSYGEAVSLLSTVTSNLDEASTALKNLAAEYAHGKDVTLAGINKQLHAAETTNQTALTAASNAYNTATSGAKPDYDKASTALTNACTTADDAFSTTVGTLQKQYDALVSDLETKTRTASSKLEEIVDGPSLYELVDKINAAIGYGLSPAALGLAGPEVRALKSLLSTYDEYAAAASKLKTAPAAAEAVLGRLVDDGSMTAGDAAALLAEQQNALEKGVAALKGPLDEALKAAGEAGGLPEGATATGLMAKLAGPLDMLAKGTAGLGVLSDVLTLINPGATGAEGDANRAAAAGNIVGTEMMFNDKVLAKLGKDFSQSTADEATTEAATEGTADAAGDATVATTEAGVEVGVEEAAAEGAGVATAELAGVGAVSVIPVAGQVIVVGTGLYLAGDWAYNHVKWFHDAVDDTGHAIATGYEATVHGIETGIDDTGKALSTAYHATTHAVATGAKDALGAAEKAGSTTVSLAKDAAHYADPLNWSL